MHQPYLIQRAEINNPLAAEDSRLSNAVDFDYMGSSEFEFGALPKSFRRIEAAADNWKMRVVSEIKEEESSLRVYSSFDDKEFAAYLVHLRALRQDKYHTKETTRFKKGYEQSKISPCNFWWDINNDTMFGFKKEFMNRVGHYVSNSLVYMNEQRKKHAP